MNMQTIKQHHPYLIVTCKAMWLLLLLLASIINSCSCFSTPHVVSGRMKSQSRCYRPISYSTKNTQIHFEHNDESNCQINRRSLLSKTIFTSITSLGVLLALPAVDSFHLQYAKAEEEKDNGIFKRVNSKLNFGYEFIPPPSVIKTSNKPLQTHLDEINLPTDRKGYTYGVTVDPIRITSLKEFGTPSEVAAKIVMAELRRDGVLDVTLASDAKEDLVSGAYDVEYISDGTRGKKHFVTRTIVKDGKLYVLTVQVKEDDWNEVKDEVLNAVGTFRVLG